MMMTRIMTMIIIDGDCNCNSNYADEDYDQNNNEFGNKGNDGYWVLHALCYLPATLKPYLSRYGDDNNYGNDNH